MWEAVQWRSTWLWLKVLWLEVLRLVQGKRQRVSLGSLSTQNTFRYIDGPAGSVPSVTAAGDPGF